MGRIGGLDVLYEPAEGHDVLLLAVGPLGAVALEAAELLAAQGIGVTVVDPRWVKPLDDALLPAAREHRLIAVVEDNGRVGAVGDAVSRRLHDAGIAKPLRTFGLPQEFLAHAKRDSVLSEVGLTGQAIARSITEAVAELSDVEVDVRQ